MGPDKLDHWDELRLIKRQLADQRAQAAAAQAKRDAEAKRLAQQANLFQLALGPVQRLQAAPRVQLTPQPPAPLALQLAQDEYKALQETLSDDFVPSTLLEMDETLSFRRPGIGQDVTNRLRKGDWSIQAHLDLHGLRRDEARDAVGQFIRNCHKSGLRCVRVVHGKGLGSEGKTPVLKGKVQVWLIQKQEVIAFVQAQPLHGGAGALLVLLEPSNRKSKRLGLAANAG